MDCFVIPVRKNLLEYNWAIFISNQRDVLNIHLSLYLSIDLHFYLSTYGSICLCLFWFVLLTKCTTIIPYFSSWSIYSSACYLKECLEIIIVAMRLIIVRWRLLLFFSFVPFFFSSQSLIVKCFMMILHLRLDGRLPAKVS